MAGLKALALHPRVLTERMEGVGFCPAYAKGRVSPKAVVVVSLACMYAVLLIAARREGSD